MTKTIMFVHGAWVTPASWDLFRARHEAVGYKTIAPAWPCDDRPVSELRRSPHPDLPKLSITAIVDHYEKLIRALPEPPVLVGHSFGGLFVQLLLDRGLGAAGVAIDPAPARGILPKWNATRAAFPVLSSWNGWNRVLTMTPEQFAWGFAHTLSPAEQHAAYERHIVPTPGRIYFQALLGIGNGLNFANATRAPLLLIAGEEDRTVEASMVRATYKKHQRSTAVTEFKAFPGRTHWLIASPGWEEIADTAIAWAGKHARVGSPETVGMPPTSSA